MYYNEFQGLKLSALGMGTMRLPVINGDNSKIDVPATEAMIDYALQNGINYFDTAWGYHGGHSQSVVAKALSRHPRDSYYLANKFPGYELSLIPKVKEVFETQLQVCGVEYFDFYLVHNVCEMNIQQYLDPQYGIYEYLVEQKRCGRIRHLGFSTHGTPQTLKRFLERYGDAMEFGQLQVNWVDWEFQSIREKAAMLTERNIPIWVMEPLRGGKLAKLSEEDEATLRALRPEESIPAWSLRFLQSLPQVVVTLSGMSNAQQLEENIRTFSERKVLSETEMQTLFDIGKAMTDRTKVPCTACRYCVSHCPQGLDIPWLLELYNEHLFTGGGYIAPMALEALPKEKWPSACAGCHSCEEVCPQKLHIPDALADFCKILK